MKGKSCNLHKEKKGSGAETVPLESVVKDCSRLSTCSTQLIRRSDAGAGGWFNVGAAFQAVDVLTRQCFWLMKL